MFSDAQNEPRLEYRELSNAFFDKKCDLIPMLHV